MIAVKSIADITVRREAVVMSCGTKEQPSRETRLASAVVRPLAPGRKTPNVA
jgi:hypothetical protein